MKRKQAFSIIGFLTLMMVFGFQNCSKVGVQDLPSASNSKVVNTANLDDQQTPPMPDDPDVDENGNVRNMPTDSNLKALCLKEKSGGISGPEISNLRGITVVESDDLTRVDDIRGVLIIRGKTAKAKAKMISNVRGAVVICGMDIEDVDDIRGQLVLVDSMVHHLNNARGRIDLLESSQIGDIKDFRGEISEEGRPGILRR